MRWFLSSSVSTGKSSRAVSGLDNGDAARSSTGSTTLRRRTGDGGGAPRGGGLPTVRDAGRFLADRNAWEASVAGGPVFMPHFGSGRQGSGSMTGGNGRFSAAWRSQSSSSA